MMMLMTAAALAAAQPASPAPAGPMTQHDMSMQMDHDADHKGMDCCKHCCKDMAGKHEGHGAEQRGGGHAGHSTR
jgi:hypothetical protein